MKLSKIIGGLAAVCAALLAVVTVLLVRPYWGIREPFRKKIDAAHRLELRRGSVTLTLFQEGADWQVRQGQAGPVFRADGAKVRGLLDDLRRTMVEDEISLGGPSAADFEVTPESGAWITILDKSGRPLAEGIFGKQAPDGTHLYFRYPSSPSVYLARGFIGGDYQRVDLERWRDRALVDIPENQIQEIERVSKAGRAVIERSSDTFKAKGSGMSEEAAKRLVRRLVSLRADGFFGPEEASAFPESKLTDRWIRIRSTSGIISLRFGAPDLPTGRVPVWVSPGPGLAYFSPENAAALFQ